MSSRVPRVRVRGRSCGEKISGESIGPGVDVQSLHQKGKDKGTVRSPGRDQAISHPIPRRVPPWKKNGSLQIGGRWCSYRQFLALLARSASRSKHPRRNERTRPEHLSLAQARGMDEGFGNHQVCS